MKALNRRQLLKQSAVLAGAGVASTLGFSSNKAWSQTSTGRNLILIFCSGGWDPAMVFDPKDLSNPNVKMPSGNLVTEGDFTYFDADLTSGSVRSFFDAHRDVSSIIRGITVRSISHNGCTKRFLTGTASETAPDFGVLAAHTHGASLPVPYMVLGSSSFVGPYGASSGRVGFNNQLISLLEDESAYPAPPSWPYTQPHFSPSVSDEDQIQAFLQARAERMRAQRGQFGANKKALDDYLTSQTKKVALKENRDRVGELDFFTSLSTQMERAIGLIENDVAWAVNVDTNLQWDSHTGNENSQGGSFQSLFDALKELIDQLKAKDGRETGNKMIDETTVAVISEMGRTPQVNGQNGKDHWGYTSALLIGSGVQGGTVYGGTDDSMIAAPVDFSTGALDDNGVIVETEHFVAGLLELLGVDSSLHFDDVTPFAPFIAG